MAKIASAAMQSRTDGSASNAAQFTASQPAVIAINKIMV